MQNLLMKNILTIALLAISSIGFSQNTSYNSTYESWSVDFMLTTQINSQPGLGAIQQFIGLGLYPRYNFYAPQDYISIGAGIPFNIGLDGYASSYGSYFQFFTDIPAELSLNFGDRATEYSEYYFGGHFGVGLNYNFSIYTDSFNQKFNSHAFGPMFSMGIKYRYMQRPVGIRVSYMKGIINNFKEDPCNCIEYTNGTAPNILTLSILYGVL